MGKTLPVIAIIGRPNVGKSALFNRFIKRRQSLVDATPGLTRDRLYGDVEWRDVRFRVVDTGGLQFAKGDRMAEAIGTQVAKAMEEASIALFVCDAKEGVLPLDIEVASWVRRWGKPVILVINKADAQKDPSSIYEFSSLGLGSPLAVSALHGLKAGDLLDLIVDRLKSLGVESSSDVDETLRPLKIAIVGRPNVGKSSLVNRLLNEERVLVNDQPGTTRDPVETHFRYQDQSYCLIDTAGIRARTKLKTRVDAVSRLKALEVIRRADACLGVLEAPVGIIGDDLKLLDAVITAGKPLCLAVNKWDLLPSSTDSKRMAAAICRQAPFLRFAPVVCTSAKTGFNVLKALQLTTEAARSANRKINSSEASRLLEIVQTDPKAPAAFRNAHLFRLIQVGVDPPTFHLLGRMRRDFRDSDVAYLEGVFRRELHLEGTPVRIRLLTRPRE